MSESYLEIIQMVDAYKDNPPLIHIGYPRALSTWLQTCFFLPENGFNVMMDFYNTWEQIIDRHCFNFDKTAIKYFLEDKFKENFSPVITHELLSGNPFHGGHDAKLLADRLKSIFPHARILIIVREQKALIRSHYSLGIFFGASHSIDFFLNPSASRIVKPALKPPAKFMYEYLKYHRVAGYYMKLYGNDNVLILPYEQFKLDPNVFIKTIDQFIGNPALTDEAIADLPFSKKINTIGLAGLNLELRRILNMLRQNGMLPDHINFSGVINESQAGGTGQSGVFLRAMVRFFSQLMENAFENRLKRKIEINAAGKFAESNRKLESLIGKKLSQYGYET